MPYRRILVGTDLSEASANAAALAVRLGDDRTRHVVAHVRPLADMPSEVGGVDVDLARLAQWSAENGIPSPHPAILFGSASQELAKEAVAMRADLVVVGHTGASRFAHLLLGSTARNVVRLATCDVLVARGPPPPEGAPAFSTIVVATDLYAASARAAARALSLSQAWDVQLHAVHAIEPGVWRDAQDAARAGMPEAPEWLDHTYADMLRKFNQTSLEGKAKEHVVHGSPARVVSDLARLLHADLVLVGTHGARGVERLLLGRHAEAIVELAPCSVLVAR